MTWKFWNWPAEIRALNATVDRLTNDYHDERRQKEYWRDRFAPPPPRLMLHGWSETRLATSFAGAPDHELFAATLEQLDQDFMSAVNDLVNRSPDLPNDQLREQVGQLRGLTEFRARLEQREHAAREAKAGNKNEET